MTLYGKFLPTSVLWNWTVSTRDGARRVEGRWPACDSTVVGPASRRRPARTIAKKKARGDCDFIFTSLLYGFFPHPRIVNAFLLFRTRRRLHDLIVRGDTTSELN